MSCEETIRSSRAKAGSACSSPRVSPPRRSSPRGVAAGAAARPGPRGSAPCILVSAKESNLPAAFAEKFAGLTVVSDARELEQSLVPAADIVLDAISADCFLPSMLRVIVSGAGPARVRLLTRGAERTLR